MTKAPPEGSSTVVSARRALESVGMPSHDAGDVADLVAHLEAMRPLESTTGVKASCTPNGLNSTVGERRRSRSAAIR